MLTSDDKVFSVYIHTCPNQKRYVGITSCNPVQRRFGSGGRRYAKNHHFWSAIQLYGWDNITHDIVATQLTVAEASALEQELIAKYNTANPQYGYNQTYGGEWGQPNLEVRKRLSAIKHAQWQNAEFRRKVVEGNILAVRPRLSEEHKQKISRALKGKPRKGHPWSEEQKALAHMRKPWNYGKTKFDCEGMQKIASAMQNREFSDATRSRMRHTRTQKFQSGYKPVWINNGIVECWVDITTDGMPDGFVLGRLDRHRVAVNKDGVTRYITEEQIDQYIADGWVCGKSDNICKAIQKARQKFVYIIDDMRFATSALVTEYLHTIGYTDIVPNTVTQLCRGQLPITSKYAELIGRLYREAVAHED